MSNNDLIRLLDQLPASLLFKRLDDNQIFANSAFLNLFNVSRDCITHFLSSLHFFDAQTHRSLSGDEHPLVACAQQAPVHKAVRLNSSARNLNCLVKGQLLEVNSTKGVVLYVSNLQDNDFIGSQTQPSPLVNHLEFSHLLSEISTQLINVNKQNIDHLIEQSLGAFGRFCGVGRCYLFSFSDNQMSMTNTHEWVAAGVEPYKDQLQSVPLRDLPYFEKIIKKELVFQVNDVRELPPEASKERAEFERERIRSVLCVAVHANGELYGFVGCDILGSPYRWRPHDVRYLTLIGQMLSNALENVANRAIMERLTQALESANQRLAQLANFDGLTGIANRRLFDERLASAIKRGARSHSPISLLMIDVDHFKQFNDTFGHGAGDDALIQVANALEQCCKRSDDLAARYGGEEFAIILPNTDKQQAMSVAGDIMQAIADLNIPFANSPTSNTLTASIGAATLRCRPSLRPLTLIGRADKSLYQAKIMGRNQVANWASAKR